MNKKIAIFLALFLLGMAFWFFGRKPESGQNMREISALPDEAQDQADKQRQEIIAGFAIFTNGTLRVFASPKYHHLSPDVYLEASNPNFVHVVKSGLTWREFFATLPMQLDERCLVTGTGERFCSDGKQSLKFYLNGEEAAEALRQPIRQGDKLLVSYGAQDESEMQAQLRQVPSP